MGTDAGHGVSNPDSFIEEVTEEVRRDRLFRLFRKYGWIGIVAILGIVGGTAYVEWRQAQEQAQAEAFGDAVLEAFDLGGPDERRTALAAIPAEGPQKELLALIETTDPAENRDATIARLKELVAAGSTEPTYMDLVKLRLVLVSGADMPIAERRTMLESLAVAGRPYTSLAKEQLAYLLIEEGKGADAIAALQSLIQEQGVPQSMVSRAAQMIMVLGGTPEMPAAPGVVPAEGTEAVPEG